MALDKIVPFKVDFAFIAKLEQIGDMALWMSVAMFSVSIVLKFINLGNEHLENLFNGLNALISVIYFLVSVASNYLFLQAENKRRDDLFDNSLGTIQSEETSQNYFTNDDLDQGIRKLGVNCFENSFFTKSITEKMVKPLILKAFLLVILILLVALCPSSSNYQILAFLLQLALPLMILQRAFRLFLLHRRVNQIFKNFQTIFSDTKKKRRNNQIVHNVVAYEGAIAWGSMVLSDKIFEEMNPKLSVKWESIKSKYSIT